MRRAGREAGELTVLGEFEEEQWREKLWMLRPWVRIGGVPRLRGTGGRFALSRRSAGKGLSLLSMGRRVEVGAATGAIYSGRGRCGRPSGVRRGGGKRLQV